MKLKVFLIQALFTITLTYWGCSKNENEICDSKPSFSAVTVHDISYSTFRITGSITPSACNDIVISQGIVFSILPLPTLEIDDNLAHDDAGVITTWAEYEINFGSITPGKTLYFRPFLVNNEGKFYGQQLEVTTLIPGADKTISVSERIGFLCSK